MKLTISPGTRHASLTLLAPIAWGTTYVTITEFLPDDRPLFIAACRIIPAAFVLLAVGKLTRKGKAPARDWNTLFVLGLFNFGLFFPLLIAGIYRLPGGVAASVGGIQPLLVALVAWRVIGTTPRRFDLFIGVAAAIGVAMVVLRPGAAIDPVGVLAALGANVSFSIGVVLTRKHDLGDDRLTTTGLQMLLSAVVIVPLAYLAEGPPPMLATSDLIGIAYLSLLATGAAFLLWFNGVRRLPQQAPPVLGLAAPITGATIGWLVLGESLNSIQIAGFLVTIGAIAYAATRGAATQKVDASPISSRHTLCNA